MGLSTALDNPARAELAACECHRYSVEVWTGEVPEGADPGEYVEYVETGCTRQTRRTFAPGHDARLKSLLIRAGASGWAVRRDDGGMASVGDALAMARAFGFEHQVAAGIERAVERRLAKADRKKSKAAARVPRAMGEQQPEAGAASRVVTIKVGRWQYPAAIDPSNNSAAFTSANGEAKVVPEGKYKLVEAA